MDIKKRLEQAPSSPGIYIMKGPKEKTIYVGKAKNLRNRLKSYFQFSSSLSKLKSKMVKEIKNFDYVVTENELEALVLEANFIKKFKPKFNIILRDDKNYPYLKLTVNEEWPKIEVVRKIESDSSLHFGPYVPAGAIWEILRFLRRNFPLRTCRHSLVRPFRPCIRHQMGRCLAPCAESLRSSSDHKRYIKTVNEVKFFLNGEKKELLCSLQNRMKKLSDSLRFEEAAQVRNTLKTIEKAWESQRVIAPELGDMDVIGLYPVRKKAPSEFSNGVYRENREASIFMLFIRNGMVIGQKGFFFKKLTEIKDMGLIASFIEQFYSKEILPPPKIILPVPFRESPIKGDFKIQRQWLSKKRGHRIRLSRAKNEKENQVLKMANDNAFFYFSRHRKTGVDEALPAIKKLLNLKTIPERIGAIDVSNISGSEAVGAFVVWENREFKKDGYRLFKIKTVKGIDDFAMIGEVVVRYLKSISEKNKAVPQLILIDGGKGQLMSAVRAMKPFNLPIEIAAIAKAREAAHSEERFDRIFLPGKKDALPLEPFTASTHLLQRIRDEVHRFAIRYHKRLRTKRTLESPLEKIKGIGKTRRLLLLRHFGNIDKIRRASIDKLASLKGINRKTAEVLKRGV